MIDLPAAYEPFLKHETRLSSVVAYLPGAEPPSTETLMPRFGELGLTAEALSIRGVQGEFDAIHAEVDDVGTLVVRRIKAPHIENHVRETMKLDQATVAALDDARWALVVQLKYSPMPIADLSDQMRFAHALAPQMIAVLDSSAQKMRSREWVAAVASARVPPAPSSLFTIHAIDRLGGFWLHTHGLQRCAGLELEMHAVPSAQVAQAANLMNIVAPGFIERRPAPGAPLSAGELLQLCWVPWQDPAATGSRPEIERETEHQGPAAVLLTHPELAPAFEGLPRFEQSKTYTGSNMAAARDALFAKDTFEGFARLHAKQHATPGWRFEVKLPVQSGKRIDFMWFRFEAFRNQRIEATLVNSPMGQSTLSSGARVDRPLAEMADWAIGAPGGGARPDSLDALEARLRAQS